MPVRSLHAPAAQRPAIIAAESVNSAAGAAAAPSRARGRNEVMPPSAHAETTMRVPGAARGRSRPAAERGPPRSGVPPPARRRGIPATTRGAARALDAPVTRKTMVKPNDSAAHTPSGRNTTWGRPTAIPYHPTALPRCAGVVSSATSALPATVMIPKPRPRTAETDSTQARSAESG